MMICPTCRIQYADDTLKFCLQDGTQLTEAPVTETPTVILGETETVVSARGWEQPDARRTVQPEARTANTVVAVLLTAIGMLVIFGVAAWIYLKDGQGNIAKNDSSNTNSKILPTVAPIATSINIRPVNTAPPPPAINTEEIERDVAKTIMTWKSMAESRDLDSYMGNYAGTVDYYRKRGASKSFVRADKQRAFSRFDSISVTITNMSITSGASGGEATAVFDKEWDFSGARRSTGKVRQQMTLRNVSGEWLITSEKDLKLYYKN